MDSCVDLIQDADLRDQRDFISMDYSAELQRASLKRIQDPSRDPVPGSKN